MKKTKYSTEISILLFTLVLFVMYSTLNKNINTSQYIIILLILTLITILALITLDTRLLNTPLGLIISFSTLMLVILTYGYLDNKKQQAINVTKHHCIDQTHKTCRGGDSTYSGCFCNGTECNN